MKSKLTCFITALSLLFMGFSYAQEKTITGNVTDQDGLPLPGVAVLVVGTTNGAQTDFDGNYTITANVGSVLRFSYLGQQTVDRTVGAPSTINVQMQEDAQALEEVVVTAMGITREKADLGYATQEVQGDEVSKVKQANFINSLSGKVAGLQIKPSGTMGGSTNAVIRGNASIVGNNQALFVVDGIPIDNDNTNSSDQKTGRGGYDYGNAAADINPDDIETINVLKGAAASALYGSRAANGVIMITTKKGRKSKGLGITINSSLMVGTADSSTLPTYQTKYGAGYGPYYASDDGFFDREDVNGDGIVDDVVPFYEDASYGGPYDANRLVYQWNSIYPQLTDTYLKPTPWVMAKNNPNTFFQTSSTLVNSVSLDGGSDKATFRLGVTNFDQHGNLPNSEIKRNTINFAGSLDLADNLTATTTFTYTKTDGKGRYGTGYDSKNPMQQFRQWFQLNVDIDEQRQAYMDTKENITWNANAYDNPTPIFSDNPYWTRFENYENDTRNRYIGSLTLNWEMNDWLSVLGRFSFDNYSELQEERINVGSADVSQYTRYNNNVGSYNYDLILNFNKDLTETINLDGNLGYNLNRRDNNSIFASTNGGLNKPGLYALSNSVSPIEAPTEYEATKMVNGVYARASLGFDRLVFVEGTYRIDRSSALPKDNNTFDYWSVSGNLIFSRLLDADWLPFGKVRANYGIVGNDTDPYRVFNTYTINTPFNGGSASNNSRLNNPNLLPEEQENWEIGLEMTFVDRRVGFDVSYYNANNINQITPVPVSNSTGYTSAWLNAGTISNKGWEVQLNLVPIKTEDFKWDMTVNWSTNQSEVVSLRDGIDNLVLASVQGGISINASVGEPYGTIRGRDLVYEETTGQPIVLPSGYYKRTADNNNVIGDINPDWLGGLYNSFTYKNFNLGFLIDVQEGGNVFSLDTWYGYATGMYDITAGTNDLGNPVRNSNANGGGVILPGVDENGQPNTVRAAANTYANPWGYARAANSQHVYDAGFVKLREASLTYNFSQKTLDRTPFVNASVALIGRNLWIIDKHTPYTDPEAGLSSGNVQGYQSGAYPSIREIGATLKLQF